VQPQRVVGQSPERSYERIYASHPDHLAVGEATLCAVYPDARNPFTHPELLDEGAEPWTVPEVWLAGPAQSLNRFVDITDVVDRKLEALKSHISQHQDPDRLDDLIKGWGAMIAQAGGLPEGRCAEGFQVVATA
jgi:LmbE family N-acetylglucosaminyl deacetylase